MGSDEPTGAPEAEPACPECGGDGHTGGPFHPPCPACDPTVVPAANRRVWCMRCGKDITNAEQFDNMDGSWCRACHGPGGYPDNVSELPAADRSEPSEGGPKRPEYEPKTPEQRLAYLGSWAVVCMDCVKEWTVRVVKRESEGAPQGAPQGEDGGA